MTQNDRQDGEIEHGSGEPTYAGTEERTEDSIARVRYQSLERGTYERFLQPGDVIDLPADRVVVEALEGVDDAD